MKFNWKGIILSLSFAFLLIFVDTFFNKRYFMNQIQGDRLLGSLFFSFFFVIASLSFTTRKNKL
jgi:hypothetical protein